MNKQSHSSKVQFFKAFGHSLRLAILEALRDKELNVSQLQEVTGASQPAVSTQLTILRNQRIVSMRREGLMVHYCVPDPTIHTILDLGHEAYQREIIRLHADLRSIPIEQADNTPSLAINITHHVT